MPPTVLLTDYAWPELEIERRILAEMDARLVVAADTRPDTLRAAIADADAVMVCWAPLPRVGTAPVRPPAPVPPLL